MGITSKEQVMTSISHRTILCAMLFVSASCLAQQGQMPARIDVAAVTGADAKTSQAVEQVRREQHDKIDAVRREADSQLAKLLTPAQLDKLREAMRKNRPADGPPQR